MSDKSAWCRHSFEQANTVDFERVADTMIDQGYVYIVFFFLFLIFPCRNSGTDIVTPGICSLAFAMLKSTNGNLHKISMDFLAKFLKKRYIFGPGVVKTIVDFQLADQGAVQYGG